MARLIGPDEGSRKAETIDSSGRFAAKRNRPATVYADAQVTQLADILTTGGAPIAGSVVTTDAYSMLPLFQFPDGVDTLWVVVDGGPPWPIYARDDDRHDAAKAALDALGTRLTAAEAVAGAAETPSGAQAKASAAQAAAQSAAAADATTKASGAQAAAATDAANKIAAHVGATDPHGDRTYTDAGLAGRVPTSRAVTAGTGLSGGGDLSTDRSLAVTYGATAGSAAQGNDARLSDARTPTAHASSHAPAGSDPLTGLAAGNFAPASVDGAAAVASVRTLGTGAQQAAVGADALRRQLVTAKGDLLVASGSGAVTRQGVGGDGRVLTADATQPGGMRWALPASDAARSLYASGQYYNPWSPDAAGVSANLNNGQLRLVPVLFPAPVTISRIGVEVTVAGSAGALYRPMVYADDGTGYPGALLLDGGALDAATTGFKEATVSSALSGLVWMGGAVQGNPATQPTIRIGFERPVVPIRLGTAPVNATPYGYVAIGITGTPPASFPAGGSASGSGPRLIVRVA